MVLELVSIWVRLEPSSPGLIRSLQPTIIGQVFSKSKLAVDVVLAALRVLDCKVSVLVDEAFGPAFEFFQRRVRPPVVETAVGVVEATLVVKCVLSRLKLTKVMVRTLDTGDV